ncbi:MAG: aminomethyl-transferring glycine dehydrogenase subunit GcvPB, partial [Spirochaetaceae bacterium]|nr:aminomethyl-transferring glycine dehydrogenase subunit GcvPB [Spirochaetaceae bacterium]
MKSGNKMKLIFEKTKPGAGCSVLPPCDVPEAPLPEWAERKKPARLPALDENQISRHYSALAKRVFGVNDGFYPLGSCTMKYNPKVNEELAALPGFTEIHPLQPEHTTRGCQRVLGLAAKYLCEIAGMDAMNFQPAAGAHGEFAGLLLFKAYHESRGDAGRTKIIVPDSAHGTNPASAVMAGFSVVNIASGPDGCVDIEALKAAAGPDTAGLMLTNPNTLGLFDPNIAEITELVHQAGGHNYYDWANLNAIMGIARPGDMG